MLAMSVSTFEDARTTLFRAFLGDEPQPSPDEFKLLKRDLSSRLEFCAALDQLVRIIVQNKLSPNEGWRDRLQAYIAAQLEARADSADFTDIQQQLDGSVELSEEYALLYETMQAEQAGAITILADTPTPDLSFLAQPLPATTSIPPVGEPLSWWRRYGQPTVACLTLLLASLPFIHVVLQQSAQTEAAFFSATLLLLLLAAWGWWWLRGRNPAQGNLLRFRVLQASLLLAALVAVSLSLWSLASQLDGRLHQEATTASARTQPNPSFSELQLGLEAQLPTPLAIYQPEPATQMSEPCIDHLRGLLFRRACPL